MIVIIEDDLVFVKNIVAKLNKEGISEIKVFNSIQSYTHTDAFLYLIDIKLEENSFDLISKISKDKKGIICVVSSYSEKEYIKVCFHNWADIYINKIIEPYLYIYKVIWLYNLWKKLHSLQNIK